MKLLFSISLSFIILLQSFGVHIDDMVQIDDFIEHAQFHSEQYGDNVFVFISKHYGELKADHDKDHQDEKEEHEQLPFQHQSHLTVVADFILNAQKLTLRTPEFAEFKKHSFYYMVPSSSQYLEGLFQPPRHS